MTAPIASRGDVARTWVLGLAGLVALIGLWQLLGDTAFRNSVELPSPSAIVRSMAHDGWSFYWPNIETTLSEAAKGFVWGNALAVALALLLLLTPALERPLLQLGVASYCLPIVAIGPVFAIVFRGETPKVALAGMAVFFTTLVGTVLGLRSADRSSLDLLRAFGGGAWATLYKVRLRAALPNVFTALRIAAPAAVLGAIIGEYLGGDRGIGVAMLSAETSLNMARTWGLALAAAAVAGLGFGAIALLQRLVTPWSRPS